MSVVKQYMLTNRGKKPLTYNIICFGLLPWSTMWKRNQSMMAELAKCNFINRLIFLNSAISLRSILARKNSSSIATLGNTSKIYPSKITSKIFVYTPTNIIPNRRCLTVLKKIEAKIMLKVIRKLNDEMPYIIFMNCPNISPSYLLDELLQEAKLSIFDFSDDFVELGYGKQTIELFRRNIEKYARVADIVLTVNDFIKKKYTSLSTNIHVIRNATNYDNFDRKGYKSIDLLEKMKNNKSPIIGYCGIANISRIDCDTLDFLLKKRSDWQFVFIGPALSNFTDRFIKYKNFHHIPPVDYQSLPDYTHYFNVAIVPFKINEHTKGNDLLKLHDFLAMGKPVVCTEIGGATDLRDVISIAQGQSDFLEKIEKALHDDNKFDILKRKKVALTNSWHNRAKELERLIKKSTRI